MRRRRKATRRSRRNSRAPSTSPSSSIPCFNRLTPVNHFEYRDGILYAENVPVPEIAKAVGTPFYCYSTATLERHYRVFSEAFADIDSMVCYAMKANSNQAVLKTLGKLGAGIDVVSEGELRRALAAGIPASRIMFSGVGKTPREMDFALEAGIYCFNVESEPELEILNQRAVKAGKKAPGLLPHQPGCRCQNACEDFDRQEGKQVRHFLGARPRRLCPGGQVARHRGDRHRHAYRQPDHRAAALRRRLQAAARAGRYAARRRPRPFTTSMSAAASAFPTRTTTTRRRCPRPMPRSSRTSCAGWTARSSPSPAA